MKHQKADLMMQYAQDAMETDKPELRWEFAYSKDTTRWYPMEEGYHPIWSSVDFVYRRKVKTININGFEVPEPLREFPYIGCKLFYPQLDASNLADWFIYEEYTWQKNRMVRGICHLTKEAAELHAKALLSFTQQD